MKVNLIVTVAGPNQGRAVPIPGPKLLIGRDADCHLRPASQAISKKHCAITVTNGKVLISDLGSMNGTVVNGEIIKGEVEIRHGDEIKVGPLEFKLDITTVPVSDGTPVPDALKKNDSTALKKLAEAAGQPAPKPAPKKEPIPTSSSAITPSDADAAAALLLSMDEDADDGDASSVPDGSTVMEIPAIDASGRLITPKKDEKPQDVESSSAANELLKKYFRRTS
jgi:pSer/pThr/pTyr-binding forkhead associated (FHA) protein